MVEDCISNGIRKGTGGTTMTELNLTDRQLILISLAMTNLYDTITRTGEGKSVQSEIMELSEYIGKETAEQRK